MTRRCICLLIPLLSAGLALMLGGCASVMRAPCEAPRISNRFAPDAYLVKLPLAAADPMQQVEGRRELNTLMDARTVALAYDVGGTHLTLLDERDGRECSIADVYDTVTENGTGLFWRKLFHSAVFIWGDVYEQRGDVFVKLYMRVYWNGPDRTATVVRAGGRGEPDLEFTGRFPESTISFPRRRLDAARIDRLKEQLKSIQPVGELRRQFAIVSSDDQRLRLASLDGREAWVSKRDATVLATELLPELEFAQAVVAYLHFKVTRSAESASLSMSSLDGFWRALASADVQSAQLQLPRAIGDVIAGSLGQARIAEQKLPDNLSGPQSGFPVLETKKTLSDELKDVSTHTFVEPEVGYRQAQEAMPTDSNILTLAALGRIRDCCTGPDDPRIKSITAALESAREIDSANVAAVQNLLNWYLLLQRLGPAFLPMPRPELDARVAALRSIVATP